MIKMERPTRETFKTAVIVALVIFLVPLLLREFFVRRVLQDMWSSTAEMRGIEGRYKFERNIWSIDQLENNNIDEVLYDLYRSAFDELADLPPTQLKAICPDSTQSFKLKYETFMAQTCAKEHYQACVSYGDLLAERSEFDRASEAYLAAAQNGLTTGASRLYYLHSNSRWAGRSEEKAQQWLKQISD